METVKNTAQKDDISLVWKTVCGLHHISRQDVRQALSEYNGAGTLDARTDTVLAHLCETGQLFLSINGYYTKGAKA